MVGSALVRRLGSEDVKLLTLAHSEVDLAKQFPPASPAIPPPAAPKARSYAGKWVMTA
jgi:hypothetical protein